MILRSAGGCPLFKAMDDFKEGLGSQAAEGLFEFTVSHVIGYRTWDRFDDIAGIQLLGHVHDSDTRLPLPCHDGPLYGGGTAVGR